MIIAALILPGSAAAEGSGRNHSPETLAEDLELAQVIVDGNTLFSLRGVTSFPAKARSRLVAERIRAVADDASFSVSDLRAVEAEDRTQIQAGERTIISVFDADAAVERLKSHHVLAELLRMRIAEAIERYRLERSQAYLVRQGLNSAIVLGVLAAALLILRWLFQRLDRVLERRLQMRLENLEAKSFRLLSAGDLKSAWHGALWSLRFLLMVILIFVSAELVLSLFPWTRWFATATHELLTKPLETMGSGILLSLPGLGFIAVLFFVTRYALRLGQLFFSGVAWGTIRLAGFEQEWAWPTYRLLRMLVIAFALVIAYPYIPGSDSAAFKGISLFAGLLMSLGASSIVANSLAGYMLIYRRAFRVGDRIKVGDVVGDVVEMRQQLTHLRTPKNEEVTIPSSVILNSNVINYSARARQGGIILHTTVGIGYETPWRQVEAMLIEAANRTEGLLREPPPFVLHTALGDFCVTYEINVYCDQPQKIQLLYTALHRNILDVFNEYGVQIMTPNYEADAEEPKVVPPEKWYLAPAVQPGDRKT
jgi:small-conductance mechanosensitive channel